MANPDVVPAPEKDRLLVRYASLSDLREDPKNARRHPPENLEAIRRSLAKFGQVEPLVIQKGTGRVIGGNGRLAVMREMGWTECPIVERQLTDREADALSLALNRTAELALWDDAALAKLLAETQTAGTLSFTGFSNEEFGQLLASMAEPVAEPPSIEPPVEPVSRPGELWTLGSHRLLCADSTDPKTVERLMQGEKGRLLHTDPPYGVNLAEVKAGLFGEVGEDWGAMRNDDLDGPALQAFLEKAFRAVLPHLDNAAWYVWHAHLTQAFFAAAAARAADLLLHRQLIWKKPQLVLTRSGMYHWIHEPCFFGWVRGEPPLWLGDKTQTSVWELDRDADHGLHPTQKPVELFAIPIRNHVPPGGVCLDPFAGSGSQILAAEQLGRRCFACEIDPKWIDVAVARFEQLSGRKADRIPLSEGEG